MLELIGTPAQDSRHYLYLGSLILFGITAAFFILYGKFLRWQIIGAVLFFLLLASQHRCLSGELSIASAFILFVFSLSLHLLLGVLLRGTPFLLRLSILCAAIVGLDLYNRLRGWGSWHLPTTGYLLGHYADFATKIGEPVLRYLPGPLNPAHPFLISILTLAGTLALVLTIVIPAKKGMVRGTVPLLVFLFIASGGILALTQPRPFSADQGAKANATPQSSGTNALIASKQNKGEIYLVVLAGPLNRDLLHAYGYPVQNTPWLSSRVKQEGWLFFDNAYAPLAPLTLTLSNQDNSRRRQPAISLFPVLRTAGFSTHWLDAGQSPLPKDTGEEFVNLSGTNEDALLSAFAATLQRLPPGGNHVIFLRLPESIHGSAADSFDPPGSAHLHGKSAWDPLIRASLKGSNRSTYQRDALLGRLYTLLDKEAAAAKLLCIIGERGDDPISGRPPYSPPFKWEGTHIPLILWGSEGYRERYPERYATLAAHRTKVFTNDLLSDLLLGAAAIETELRRPTFDISSPDYQLTPETARIANQLPIAADPLINMRSLPQDDPLVKKITIHRVNSLGRLGAVQQAGFNRIELDVNFRKDAAAPCGGELEIMHRWQSRSWTSLETFLQSPHAAKIEFIWLDGKNLDGSNAEATYCALERIEQRTPIKKKMIIETYSFPEAYARFAAKGWRFSGLPDSRGGAKGTDVATRKANAARIAAAIKRQQISDITFRTDSYNFIKEDVEPLLPANVVYHVQEVHNVLKENIPIDQRGFFNLLRSQDYSKDDRVKTILFEYDTFFFL